MATWSASISTIAKGIWKSRCSMTKASCASCSRVGEPVSLGWKSEEISLKGLPSGTYFVEVTGYRGLDQQLHTTNPYYTLTVVAPQVTVRPDGLEPNNELAMHGKLGRPTNLNQAAGVNHVTGLSIHTKEQEPDVDFFQFTIRADAQLTRQHSVSIEFERQQGNWNSTSSTATAAKLQF